MPLFEPAMDHLPAHILQSPAWGEFRTQWGTKVVRRGQMQLTIHPIPFLPWNVGYLPRVIPQDIAWDELAKVAEANRCLFIKIEPNSTTFEPPAGLDVRPAKNMFGHATYLIDLQKSEQELLAAMHSKTRYNIRFASKKGVLTKVGNNDEMFEEFLKMFHETNLRHHVVIHPDEYYRTLFRVFKAHGMAEIVTSYYDNVPLSSMVLLYYGETLFYPFGASTDLHRDKMPSQLTYWRTIEQGKKRGCKYFDMWNCLLPEQESPSHPWFGFHKFKKGFGGEMVQFCGAFDIVFSPRLYGLMLLLNNIRWKLLKLAVSLRRSSKAASPKRVG